MSLWSKLIILHISELSAVSAKKLERWLHGWLFLLRNRDSFSFGHSAHLPLTLLAHLVKVNLDVSSLGVDLLPISLDLWLWNAFELIDFTLKFFILLG